MRDVIVVGAGPAGAAAAKKCAEYGLATLMLEKRGLPRDKVCSGMVMGPVAHTLIKKEFGDIPPSVLSQPDHLEGYVFHVPGFDSEVLNSFIRLSWRRNLDYWMTQQAEAKGAQIWDGAKVTAVREERQGYSVSLERNKEKLEIQSRFVIGADGATSVVRKCLFPGFEVRCVQIYEECHVGELDLDMRYFHWLRSREHHPALISIHRKDDITVIDFGHITGQLTPFIAWAKDFLARNYHFDARQPPVWHGGCLEPIFPKGLITHQLLPARGGALLVGEAAGFVLPITGEGIGPAIYSGLAAANSIVKAVKSGINPDRIYLAGFESTFATFSELIHWIKKIEADIKGGTSSLPMVLAASFGDTLRMF